MPAPDYAEPIVGWRVWHVVEREGALRLCSPLFRSAWYPRRELVASCKPSPEIAADLLRSGRFGHRAPDARCSCGIYAGRAAVQASGYMTRLFKERGVAVHRVLGTVQLWGTVVECVQGWRGSIGYPAHIFVPAVTRRRRFHPDRLRPSRVPVGDVALALADYGVPVDVVECTTLGELADAVDAVSGTTAFPYAA